MRNEISIIIVGFEFINSVWISDIYRFSHHRRIYQSIQVSTQYLRYGFVSLFSLFLAIFSRFWCRGMNSMTRMTTRPQRSQTDTGQTSQTRYRYDSTGNK